jgi:hypothetical protein
MPKEMRFVNALPSVEDKVAHKGVFGNTLVGVEMFITMTAIKIISLLLGLALLPSSASKTSHLITFVCP